MLHPTGFAVHQVFGANYFASESRADGLVSQTDAEYRNFVRGLGGEMADQVDADASLRRSAGPGRNHDAFRTHRFDLSDGHFVVTAHLDLSTQFSKILDQVVSERIVVIEDEDHAFILNPGLQSFRLGVRSNAISVGMPT